MPRSANAASSLPITSGTVIRLIAAGSRTRCPAQRLEGWPNSRATASGYLSTTRCWLKYGPVRCRFDVAYSPTTGVPTAVAMWAGPGVGAQHDARARENREQLFQARPADQVLRLRLCRGRDVAAVGLLDRGRSARQQHLRAVAPRRVIRDLGVPVRAPVAVVAEALARARADHECRLAAANQRRDRGEVSAPTGNVPARLSVAARR